MARVEIKTFNPPPLLNPESPGDSLFHEALCYRSLELVEVGKHVSCFLTGSELHIHFRRNLDQLKPSDYKSKFAYARAFSDEIDKDLSQLSKLFADNDPRFHDVETIIGLTGLSAVWGRSNGWNTEIYSGDHALIELHEAMIENKQMETHPKKLTIFTISREDHIRHFPPPTSHKIYSRQG